MRDDDIVLRNRYGGFCEVGRSFMRAKWTAIVEVYEKQLQAHGGCTERRFETRAGISRTTTIKAIQFYEISIIVPSVELRGHGVSGAGMLVGMKMAHHAFIYKLYLDNPSLRLIGYVDDLENKFRLQVSCSTIQRWFMTTGPFKGTISTFSNSRDSWQTYCLLEKYLDFIISIKDHRCLVFVDKKPMREIIIYGTVRRDVQKGTTPSHKLSSVNSKNR